MWTFPAERVLNQRNLPAPDGRPLYAYRVTEEELEELRLLFRMEWGGPKGIFERAQERAFCLFAAEWWRRNHDHGPWAWQGTLEAVGWSGIQMSRLYRVVEAGLRFWKRPLLHLAAGDRAFLVTLACEGGLPLRLLLREGAALRNYFKGLLEEFHYLRPAGFDGMEIARKVAYRLPLSLRQPPVYRLGGELAEKILELQSQVRDATDPVAALDLRHPGWREELPLRVEDDMARALLNNLVIEASRIRTRPRGAGLRVRRLLQRSGEDWIPSAEVSLPTRVSLDDLEGLLGAEASRLKGRRCELSLATRQGGLRTLAFLTPRSADAEEQFFVEPVSRSGSRLLGEEALQDCQVAVTCGGEALGPFDLPGGPRGAELPWVFGSRSEGVDELERLGMGTVRSRQGVLWVAAPGDWEVEALNGGKAELAGGVAGAERTLWKILGGCEIERSDGERFRVTCGEKVEHSADYVLAGSRIPELSARYPLFQGPPRLLALADDGTIRSIPAKSLEWRRVGWPSWLEISPEALGDVLLRYRAEGAVEWLGRAVVLPEKFYFRLEPDRDSHRGAIHLEGLAEADVLTDTSPELQAQSSRNGEEGCCIVEFRCPGEPPASVTLRIAWPHGRSAEVQFPFPVRLARFRTLQGRVLAVEEEIAASRLGEVEAVAVTTDPTQRFHLEGVLQAESLPADGRGGQDLYTPLLMVGPQLRSLPLATVQRAAMRVLSVVADAKASLRLRVTGEGVGVLAPHPVQATRHDLSFHWEPGDDRLRVAHPSGAKPSSEILSALQVTARPLGDPLAEEFDLARMDEAGVWALPEPGGESGSLLLAGWDGRWCRVAPSILPAADAGRFSSESSFVQAVVANDRLALEQLFVEMSRTPNHPGWDDLFRYLRALSGYPTSSLRVFRVLARLPEAVAMACLVVGDEDLHALWALLEELPISLYLMPADAWAKAACRMKTALRESFPEDAQRVMVEARKDLSRFPKYIEKSIPAAGVLLEWMLRHVGGGDGETPTLTMAASPQRRMMLRGWLETERTEAIGRRGQGTWTRSHLLDRLSQRLQVDRPELREWLYKDPYEMSHRESLTNAPVLAATVSAWQLNAGAPMLLEIMAMRDLDPDYFDRAHSLALAVLLAGRGNAGPSEAE